MPQKPRGAVLVISSMISCNRCETPVQTERMFVRTEVSLLPAYTMTGSRSTFTAAELHKDLVSCWPLTIEPPSHSSCDGAGDPRRQLSGSDPPRGVTVFHRAVSHTASVCRALSSEWERPQNTGRRWVTSWCSGGFQWMHAVSSAQIHTESHNYPLHSHTTLTVFISDLLTPDSQMFWL